MIDYNSLIEISKQKFQKYDGSYFTEYFDYSKNGYELIAKSDLMNHDKIEINEHQKGLCNNLSIATSVMNRTEHLLESVVTWLRLPFKKIVIIDWSSDKPVSESLIEHGIDDDRISITRIEGQTRYSHSEARNIKMSQVDGWVLSIDSDIMLTPKFGRTVVLSKDTKAMYMNDRFNSNKSLYGTTIFHKDEFDSVGGCTNVIDGWGAEDHDLYLRMKDNGCTVRSLGERTLFHIPHDDFSRTYNTNYEDLYESLSENSHKTYSTIFEK